MKLHFDPNQDYQLQAIKSIVDIFEGQPLSQSDFEFSITDGSLQLFLDNVIKEIKDVLYELMIEGIKYERIGGQGSVNTIRIAETKSTTDVKKLRNEEKLKIKCGEAHFNEFDGVEYRHVASVMDLS